ncbi:hypothetical protein F3W84_20285 [Ochrobactrum quorumnocens]|uniref:Uncharacterized protein n=2 Tax=Ochrobactrum quorumnocens TaxID=271865 RepID=A0A5N1JWB9_9HYPH|nr:hypothetical protein F3W84_20285 [[Ochrobactrum] quorumnocens]
MRILAWIFSFFMSIGVSFAAASTEFDRQCLRLYPYADAFAQKFLSEAIPFSRMFYPAGGTRGEPENFSVLFSDAFPNSHFIMGRVLNADRNLHYVGLYYKTAVEPLPVFKSENIGFVDFQDNVGLRVNGRKQILTAVRQFVTNKIPQRYGVKVHNCEPRDMEGHRSVPNRTTLVQNPENPSEWIYLLQGSEVPKVVPYRVSYGLETAPHIWKVLGNTVIDANGALLVPQEWRESACTQWHDIYAPEAIAQEICGLEEFQPQK